MASTRKLIIGAGMVGSCCALYLQRAGHDVTLIDPHPPGSQTSFGNAATIATYACIPVNHPKLLKSLPSLMFGSERPLSISPGYALTRLPWLFSFLRHCRRDRVDQTISALGALLRHAEDTSLTLFQAADAMDLIRRNGTLYLYSDTKTRMAAKDDIARRRDQGMSISEVKAEDVRELEPTLAPIFASGILYNDGFQLRDPQQAVLRLVKRFSADGGEVVCDRVQSIEPAGLDQVRVHLSGSMRVFKDVVIAAGAWSTRIEGSVIDRLPLDTERGYHVMFPDDASVLSRPVGLADAGLYLSPVDGGLRAAGTVELAGLDAKPNQRRLDYIESAARRALPSLSRRGDTWLGFRPTLPDSLPVIGRSSRHPSVIYAFGHQHVGLTLGGVTGKLVQQIMDREDPIVDPTPYAAQRFLA
ncbi:MAG: FAD-dependent oxidoreductase [Pseudomonadota bacterium]|nr:FAD-dependent oxidoreductase [Pseudomonadota bacterium]